MPRRPPASLLLAAAAALALTACAHASANSANHRNSGTGGFGAVETDPSAAASPDITPDVDRSPPTTDPSPPPSPSKSGNGKSNGNGGGSGYGNGTGDGPKIVSFTATRAVCPVDAKPGAPHGQPGKGTSFWDISSTDRVHLAMDGGLSDSEPRQQRTHTV